LASLWDDKIDQGGSLWDDEPQTPYNAANQAHWKKRLANQPQLKAAPERSLWRRVMDNIEHTVKEYNPATLAAPWIAAGVEAGDGKTYDERRKGYAEGVKQRRENFQAVDPANSVADKAADITGSIIGSILSDPTNLIGGGAKTLGGKMFEAAGIGAGFDALFQGGEMATGIRDEYDPVQGAVNAAASPVFAAGQHGAGKAWDRWGPKRADGDAESRRGTDEPQEDSIDRRIRGLEELAVHKNTPKHEAEAARRMAEKLRTKYGRPSSQSPEEALSEAPRGTSGPLSIQDAAGFAKKFGTVTSTVRSAAKNKKVGGAKNSFHLTGRAMDVARKPGVSHSQIEAELRRAGYNIVESIDEGDHSHFAFDFKGGVRQAAAEEPVQAASAGEDYGVDDRAPQFRNEEDDGLPTMADHQAATTISPVDFTQVPFVTGDPDIDAELARGTAPHQNEDIPTSLTDVISGEDLQRLVDGPHRELVRSLLSEHSNNPPAWRVREIHNALQELNDPYLNDSDPYNADWDEPIDIEDDVDIDWDDIDADFGEETLARSVINSLVNPLHPMAARQRDLLDDMYHRSGRYAQAASDLEAGHSTRAEHDAVARETAEQLGYTREYDEVFANREGEPEAYRRYEERTGNAIGPLTRSAVENVASNHDLPLERAARMYIRGLGRDGDTHPFVREVQEARDALAEMTMTPREFAEYKALPDGKKTEVKILDDLPENVVEFPQNRIVGSETKPRLIIKKIEPYYDDSFVVTGSASLKPEDGKQPEWALPSFRMVVDKEDRSATIDIYGASTNKLGPKELLALSEQIAKRFPYIDNIGGYRVTGVRGKMGKPGMNNVPIGKLRDKKPKVPDELPENAVRINQKELDRMLQEKKAAMEEAEQRQTGRLTNLQTTLDNIYNSMRDGEAYMTPGDINAMRDESFIDDMILELDGDTFPKSTLVANNEDLIRDISASFFEIEELMKGIQAGTVPLRQKPELKVIEGGKKDSLLTKVADTIKEIADNEEGVFRPFNLFGGGKGYRSGSVGTPPPTPPTPLELSLERLFKGVKKAKRALPEQERERSAERSRRVSAMLGRRAHTRGVAGLRAEKSELGGELPKVDIEPIRDQFTPDEIDDIMEDIKASRKLSPLENITVRDAVDALLDGKLPTPGEHGLIYRVYPQLVEAVMAHRSTSDKVKSFLRQVWETPRGSMGSGDVSFSGRQGGMMVSRPQWWKATFKQFKALSPTQGDEVLGEQTERIVNHPLYDQLKKMGIELMDVGGHGNRDEFAVQNLAEMKYSPTKHIVKGSNRAYTYMSNELRAQLALDMLDKHKADGVDIKNKDYLKTLGEYINTFTGRGKLNNKSLDAGMTLLNLAFFAPRFVLSTFKRFSPFLWGKMLRHPAILKEAARDSGAYLLTLFGALGLADWAGYEVSFDPRSPTGLKIKHGNTTYDIGAGLVQTASLISKIATDEKITGKGDLKDLKNPKYGEDDLYDVASTFLRTKFHPMLAYLVDMKTGKNVVGEDFNTMKDTMELFMPMYSTTMAEHIKEVGPEGAVAAFPAGLGVGMNTFKPRESKTKEKDTFEEGVWGDEGIWGDAKGDDTSSLWDDENE
jgi:hypothetical protein